MKPIIIIILLCIFHAVDAQTDDTDTLVKTKISSFPGYTIKNNVVYTTVDAWQGKMDIYIPQTPTKPVALIIIIHGGGWVGNSKESQGRIVKQWLKCGYAVANVEYRLADVKPAPAAIEDVRCALAYLVKHASELNLDTGKIVLSGESAGAHLALMAGLLKNDATFSKNCMEANNIKVAAIIDKSGITDVAQIITGDNKRKWAIKWLGNKINDAAFIKSVSPVNYVNSSSPPIFIVHANGDPVVPYDQSVELNEKLKQYNIKSRFITVPEETHTGFSEQKNQEVIKEEISFLKEIGL